MNLIYPLFLEHINQSRLIQPGETILLAFSGGKDSVVLFHLLRQLQKDLAFRLVVVYFNHRLRQDAAEEEKWVVEFCQGFEQEYVIGTRDVWTFKTESRLNLEHAASISRYRFFQEVSGRFPHSKVATAHTRSDLSETFFIKLLRGSGLQGLSGIYSRKENHIIRPLLLFSTAEVLAFLKRNNLSYYTDYTNAQDVFLRNRIRQQVIPGLEKIEPDLDRRIFRTVSIIQDEYDYFARLAQKELLRHLKMVRILPVDALQTQHVAMQRHILREYVRMLKGNLLDIDFDHIEALRTQCDQVAGLAIPGMEFKFRKGFIFPADLVVPEYRISIPSPKSFLIQDIGRVVRITPVQEFKKPGNNQMIIIPAASVIFPMTVREPQAGDRYVKINTGINQKVFEMIRASGIPSEMRNYCPVLVNGNGKIIWVVGSPVADEFKVTDPKEQELLEITIA